MLLKLWMWFATKYFIDANEQPLSLTKINQTKNLRGLKVALGLVFLPFLKIAGKVNIDRVLYAIVARKMNFKIIRNHIHTAGF